MKKVEIEGNEVHVSELGKKGEVVTRWTYPANLTYRAAILEHCDGDEKLMARVQAAIDAPDVPVSEAKPAPVKSAAKAPAKKKKK